MRKDNIMFLFLLMLDVIISTYSAFNFSNLDLNFRTSFNLQPSLNIKVFIIL